MDQYGRRLGESLRPGVLSSSDRYGAVYYDAAWVFHQIARFRNEPQPWTQYAEWARDAYVNDYLVPNSWGAAGWWRFPHGLYENFRAGGSTTIDMLTRIRDSPGHSKLIEYQGIYDGHNQAVARVMAYALQANVLAERAGLPRVTENGTARVEKFVEWSSDHFKQWETGQYNASDTEPRNAPFMAALLSHALIEYITWEEANGRDPNRTWPKDYAPTIESGLVRYHAWLRGDSTVRTGAKSGTSMWVNDQYKTFLYEDLSTADPSQELTKGYELNNLIAYQYAWLATRLARTGNAADAARAQEFMTTAQQLFIGSAHKAWIEGGGKFYNQAYRLSILAVPMLDQEGLGLCRRAAPKSPPAVRVN
jgi:hypothetical protein